MLLYFIFFVFDCYRFADNYSPSEKLFSTVVVLGLNILMSAVLVVILVYLFTGGDMREIREERGAREGRGERRERTYKVNMISFRYLYYNMISKNTRINMLLAKIKRFLDSKRGRQGDYEPHQEELDDFGTDSGTSFPLLFYSFSSPLFTFFSLWFLI